MELRLTIVVPEDGDLIDVTVRATPDRSVADLRAALERRLRMPVPRLSIGAATLPDDLPLGMPPLLDGTHVRVGAPVDNGPSSALRLDVTAGPDCGSSRGLPPGRVVVGRDPSAQLTVADPHLSRRHAVVEVGSHGVRMADLGSTNGTPGKQADDISLDVGAEFALGTSRFAVRRTGSIPAVTTGLGDGTVAIHRQAHLDPAPFAAAYTRPRPPGAVLPPRFPWLPLLLPLPICAVLAVVLGPQLLAFALLGPLVSGATAWSERRAYRRSRAADEASYATECAALDQELARAQRAEKARLARTCPDPALIRAIAVHRSDRLWERRAGGPVLVRLGTGVIASDVLVTDPVGHRSEPAPALTDAPVTIDLTVVHILGICAPEPIGRRIADGIVGQIATLHSPADLSITLQDSDRGPQPFLPHRRRRAVHVVVDLDGGVRERSAAAGRDGVVVVAVGSRLAELPVSCGAIVEVDESGWGILRRAHDDAEVHFVVDQVHDGWLEEVARSLAPCRDPHGAADGLPEVVSLADLHAVPVGARAARHALRSRWAEADDGLALTLGRTSEGPLILDLGRDGPHALVGGTTGAGKSELLQALVVGLAVAYPPSAVTFLLIDYKGGSAFGECARLPHTTGVVTDLSGDLATRALVSLRAEIRRREHAFARAGATDLASYRRLAAHDRDLEPLPRLVVVVDEFRMLVDEQPGFVDGIVRLAALGRSLGLHLVLATQRPAGCVNADIQANVNVRIALRVRDRADSEHVIESPEAAALPDDAPGRAIVSLGDGRSTTFQTAFGGMPWSPPHGELSLVDGHEMTRAEPWSRGGGPRVTELALLVEAAATAHDGPPPRPVWHEPLPEQVSLDTLVSPQGLARAIGLLDRPEVGTQEVLTWNPAAPTNLAFVGGPGSGRSTALRTLAVATAPRLGEPITHIHVIDTDDVLTALARLPHVGTVLDPADRQRFTRFVGRLRAEVQDRRRLLADRGLSDLGEWPSREQASAPPRLLVLVDNWDTLAGTGAASVDVEALALVDELQALLESSRAVGIHAAVTGGRALLHSRAARIAETRITLGGLDGDGMGLGALGVRPGPAKTPPGHGSVTPDGAAVLIAHVGTDPRGAAQIEAIVRLASGVDLAPGDVPPWSIAPLPDLVPGDRMPHTAYPIAGLDEDGTWVGFDPSRDGRLVLICGPRRSGRTSTLRSLADQAIARGEPVATLTIATTIDDWPSEVCRFGPDDAEGVRAWIARHPAGTLLADDAERLVGSPADTAATEATIPGRFNGWVIAAVETASYGQLFRGLAVEVGRRRTGILLSPRGLLDGEAFGVRVPRTERLLPGRGFVISAGEATAVQVGYAATPRPVVVG